MAEKVEETGGRAVEAGIYDAVKHGDEEKEEEEKELDVLVGWVERDVQVMAASNSSGP